MFQLRNIILFGIIAFVAADSQISLYEHDNHQGGRAYLRSSGECQNVQGDFNDKASSVDTHNTCMIVYDHAECQGDSFRYSPGVGQHNALKENGFNDRISSVRAC